MANNQQPQRRAVPDHQCTGEEAVALYDAIINEALHQQKHHHPGQDFDTVLAALFYHMGTAQVLLHVTKRAIERGVY